MGWVPLSECRRHPWSRATTLSGPGIWLGVGSGGGPIGPWVRKKPWHLSGSQPGNFRNGFALMSSTWRFIMEIVKDVKLCV